jgi:excisionase family DNA binding protein
VGRAVSAALAAELASLDAASTTHRDASTESTPAALAALPPVFTFADLQRVVPVGRTRLWEAVRVGEIPSRQVGRRRLFTREAVSRWLTAPPPNPAPDPAAAPLPLSHRRRAR